MTLLAPYFSSSKPKILRTLALGSLLFILLLILTKSAWADVRSIKEENVRGRDGYRITCTTGSPYKVYQTADGWHELHKGHLGTKVKKYTIEKLAETLCTDK